MGLLDLPPEVFQPIFSFLVAETDLELVFQACEVCKVFAQVIEQELLSNTPIERFQDRTHGRPSGEAYDWLKARIEIYLFNHARGVRNGGTPLLQFLNKAVDELMIFEPSASDEEGVRTRYLKDLITATVVTDARILQNHLLHQQDDESSVFPQTYAFFEAQQIDVADAFAAAAAVGNYVAMHFLAEKSRGVLENGIIFGSSLTAAAACGKVDIVGSLLQDLEWSKIDGRVHIDTVLEIVENALVQAVRKSQFETSENLLRFRYRYSRGSYYLCKELVSIAAANGSVDIFRNVMEYVGIDSDFSSSYILRRPLARALLTSCEKGHLEFARLLLRKGYTDVNFTNCNIINIYAWEKQITLEDPLVVAVKHSRAAIVQLLLDYGADISVPQLLRTAVCAKGIANFETMKVLINHGTFKEIDAYSAADECARKLLALKKAPANSALRVDTSMTLVLLCKGIKDAIFKQDILQLTSLPSFEVREAIHHMVECGLTLSKGPHNVQADAHDLSKWIVAEEMRLAYVFEKNQSGFEKGQRVNQGIVGFEWRCDSTSK